MADGNTIISQFSYDAIPKIQSTQSSVHLKEKSCPFLVIGFAMCFESLLFLLCERSCNFRPVEIIIEWTIRQVQFSFEAESRFYGHEFLLLLVYCYVPYLSLTQSIYIAIINFFFCFSSTPQSAIDRAAGRSPVRRGRDHYGRPSNHRRRSAGLDRAKCIGEPVFGNGSFHIRQPKERKKDTNI